MNKQPQTCYVESDKHSTGVYHYTQESTPCRKLKNVYIFTKEELEAQKNEWQRESAEKAWYFTEQYFGYANADFKPMENYLSQNYPVK